MKKRTDKKGDVLGKVIGGPARVSYAHVFKPTSVHPEKPDTLKYSCVLMVKKSNTVLVKELKRTQQAVIEAARDGKLKGVKVEKLKLAIRDGDDDFDLDKNPEYAGHWILSPKSDHKPGVVDVDNDPLTTDDEFYSGCYAQFSIKFYAFNTAGNKGIGAQLNHLRKVKDGERFGIGRTSADEDFADDWEDDDDDYEDEKPAKKKRRKDDDDEDLMG